MTKKEEKELRKAKQALEPKEHKPNVLATVTIAVILSAFFASAGTYGYMKSRIIETKPIVTMKGDVIDIEDFYKDIKSSQSQSAKAGLLIAVMEHTLEKDFGDKVSDKDVSELYNKKAKEYGDQFEKSIAQYGYTPETYRKSLRLDLLMDYAYKKEAKKEITEDSIKQEYEAYFPEVTAKLMVFTDRDSAQQAKDATAGTDFQTVAQERSGSSTIDYTFDSDSKELPKPIMDTAWKQDKGAISDVVEYDDTNGQKYFFVVQTVDKQDKKDFKASKDDMRKRAIEHKSSEKEFQNKVLAAVFKKHNVKIIDEDFKGLLDEYNGVNK